MKMIVCRRRQQIEKQEANGSSLKEEEENSKGNALKVEVFENPNPSKDGEDKYLMIAKYSSNEELQNEDTDAEVSIKAFRQRGRYEKEEPEEWKSQRWTSASALKRAKEALDHDGFKQKLHEKKADFK